MTTIFVPIRHGKFNFSKTQEQILADACQKYDGKTVRLRIDGMKSQRTLLQNAYLWSGVYGTLANELGETTEDIHALCKQMFLPRTFTVVAGKEVQKEKSTTDLNRMEFSDYIDHISAWAAEFHGIAIPPPEYVC